MKENTIEGRNAVIEALRSGQSVDKLYVQEGLGDGAIQTVLREAKKKGMSLCTSSVKTDWII